MIAPVYEDDFVRLYQGDCLEVLPMVRDELGVVITDPPYGIAYESNMVKGRERNPIANDQDLTIRDRVLAALDGLPMAVFGTWKRPRPDGVKALLIWDKGEASGMGDLAMPWRPNTEEIYILGRGWHGHRDSCVLRDTSVGTGSRSHPTEKPVKLLQRLIQKAPDGVIFDPFCGVGGTLVAAKNLGRRAIGCEVDERYCKVAVRRLAQDVLDVGV